MQIKKLNKHFIWIGSGEAGQILTMVNGVPTWIYPIKLEEKQK
jgi:hypothetical protein